MKDQAVDYVKILRKNQYHAQEFTYDKEKWDQDEKSRAVLKVDLANSNDKLKDLCYFQFAELMQSLMHLKIMRTFVDGVLRFNIPPKFFMCIIKPGKNQDKIQKRLSDTFAEADLKDIYGAKEDAQDEDFYPYVMTTLSNPQFLM